MADGKYAFVFDSGENMSGPMSQLLTEEVVPSAEIDIVLNLQAPAIPGKTYTGQWKFQNDSGETFGLGSNADAVQIEIRVENKIIATP